METKTKRTFFLKKIQKTNEIFNNSTPEQKRVMIAQDCIRRIELGLLLPKKSRIITVPNWQNVNQENVNNLECEVCAKGGLLASYIGRVNNFDVNTFITNGESNVAHKKLFEIFTLEQLAIIEFAFEGEKFIDSVNISGKLSAKLIMFYKNYETDEKRLIAIYENIIENNGDFILY